MNAWSFIICKKKNYKKKHLLPEDILCAKFGWNSFFGSEEEYFLTFINIFSLFLYYIPLEKSIAFNWINSKKNNKKTWIPFTQDGLCKFGWNWPSESKKCEKFTHGRRDGQTDRQTAEDRQSDDQAHYFT